jgi:glycosyltransferase involved in cell wall biosynthesis
MKITFMIDILDSNLGGTENQLIKMINGLDKRKFQVELICFDNSQWFEANAKKIDCRSRVIAINRFKKAYTYINFLKLVAHLREEKPDVVHTFFPAGNTFGVFAARLAGIKKVISSRRDYGEWMQGPYLFTTKVANRFVEKIIANSNMVKELTERKELVSGAKVDVIYNGIDTDLFRDIRPRSGVKKTLNIPDRNRVVGIVANFRPMKHHYTFVKAANEILKTRKDVDFLLVGTGQLKEETERLAAELKISGSMHFAGPQQNVIPYLSIMDVGVNCSEGEGLSNAVMEYMAAGVPAVVSNAGGNPDLITHNVNGYVFDLDDHGALASFILKLLDDKAACERFKSNALEKVREEMSLDAMLAKYEEIYKRLANG